MGKKLKKAPVYFTFVQIRFNQVLQLAPYVPAIQEQMRLAGYPDFKRGGTISISLNQQIDDELKPIQPVNQTTERYMFSDIENTKGFILDQNSLSFQTARYETFESLTDDFMRGFGVVHENLRLEYWDRLGLRYLDAVVPKPGSLNLNEFLVGGVLGIFNELPDEATVFLSFSQTHFNLPDCTVLARTIIQIGQLGFPMDLQPLGLNIGKEFQNIDGLHAIVDTDAWIETRNSLADLSAVKSQMAILRAGVGVAFEATVTKEAFEEWSR